MSYKSNPPTLSETRERIYTAINEMGSIRSMHILSELGTNLPQWYKTHLEMLHSAPNPSTLMDCRLKQWFQVKGFETDQITPISWKIRRAMGVLAEPYWLTVLATADFLVGLPNKSYPCGQHMQAHPDAILDIDFLVELKSISGWGYKKLIEHAGGMFGAEFGHYIQAQLYMYAANKEWCLYLASAADPNLLQSILRQQKKYKRHYNLEPIYLEWIHRDEGAINAALDRAEIIVQDAFNDSPPEREFKGFEYDLDGSRNFPCGYCMYLSRCSEVTSSHEESIRF